MSETRQTNLAPAPTPYAVTFVVDHHLLDDLILSIIAVNPDALNLNKNIAKLGANVQQSAKSQIDKTIQRWTKENMLHLMHTRIKDHSYTPNSQYEIGFSPIMFAAKYAHDENVIAALLKAGARPDDEVNYHSNRIDGYTAAMIAAYFGNVAFFQATYHHQQDPRNREAKDAFVKSINKRVPIRKKIKKTTRDPQLTKFEDWDALGIAIQWGNADLVRYLLLSGANLHARFTNGTFVYAQALEELRRSPDETARRGLPFIELIIKEYQAGVLVEKDPVKLEEKMPSSQSASGSSSTLMAPSSADDEVNSVMVKQEVVGVEALLQMARPNALANAAHALLTATTSSADKNMSSVPEDAAPSSSTARPSKKRPRRISKSVSSTSDRDDSNQEWIPRNSNPKPKKQKTVSRPQQLVDTRRMYQADLPENFPTQLTLSEFEEIQRALSHPSVHTHLATPTKTHLLFMLNEQLEAKITYADIKKQQGLNQIQTAVLYSICRQYNMKKLFNGLIEREKQIKLLAAIQANRKRNREDKAAPPQPLHGLSLFGSRNQVATSPHEHSHSHSTSTSVVVDRDPPPGGGMGTMGRLAGRNANAVNQTNIQPPQQGWVPYTVPLSFHPRRPAPDTLLPVQKLNAADAKQANESADVDMSPAPAYVP